MTSKTTEHIRKVAASALFIGAVNDEWRMFSDDPRDYTIGLPIGHGASSIVYAARWLPKDGSPALPCAVKVADLDKLPPASLRLLRRETQLMSLSKHPNVLRVRGSWVEGHSLYIALRLMNAGSAADVMRYGWPGGMEEEVVKCILRQALEGLNYLHINGFIHRDVKAANLLIDDDGTVLLGDLGVAASLCDEEPIPVPSGSGVKLNFDGSVGVKASDNSHIPRATKKLGKRKSFVGTPCWMAPELISGKQYDAKADIWSFGITAIELTQGRAPRSREAPAKVLLKTVQDEPPSFSREGGAYKYSKAFKDIIDSCLVKDPASRPSAAELLDSSFFKSAKKKSYLVGAILKDLPPLTSRQERRSHNSNSVNRNSTSSFASWDFSSHPVTPTPTTMKGHSPYSPVSTHSTYHSYHPSSKIASPIECYESEDRDASPSMHESSQGVDVEKRNPYVSALQEYISSGSGSGSGSDAQGLMLSSSPDSSVIDDDEESINSPTTSPELLSASLPSSSVATTPLSCSPCANIVLRESIPSPIRPPAVSSASVHRPTSTRPRISRPGSSPTQSKPDVSFNFVPLKRTTSVGANASQNPKNSSSNPGPFAPSSLSRPVAVPERVEEQYKEKVSKEPKESRWRKLIKGAGSKIVDVATSGKASEVNGTLRGRRNS